MSRVVLLVILVLRCAFQASGVGQGAVEEQGSGNQANGTWSVVGGGTTNLAFGYASTIGGGVWNTGLGVYTTISAGLMNTASGGWSTVGGGYNNDAHGAYSTVCGGIYNTALGYFATVCGGGGLGKAPYGQGDNTSAVNLAMGDYTFVGGGTGNSALGAYSAVIGFKGVASDTHSLVLGFSHNGSCHSRGESSVTVCADNGFFVNGVRIDNITTSNNEKTLHPSNTVDGDYAVLVDGTDNAATADYATVGGGAWNSATDVYATIAGGFHSLASANYATVAGGGNNSAKQDYAAIGGGNSNMAYSSNAVVGGGFVNKVTAAASYGTVGGGNRNTAKGQYSTVSGGSQNTAKANWAFVGGGRDNIVGGLRAVVGGGWNNVVSGDNAFIGGGKDNSASGEYSSVVGGSGNIASGSWSVAVGQSAEASDLNSGVFGFTSSGCASVGDGTVNFCSDNGFFLNGLRLDNVTGLFGSTAYDGQTSSTLLEINATIVALLEVDDRLWANASLQLQQIDQLSTDFSQLIEADHTLWLNASFQQEHLSLLNRSIEEILTGLDATNTKIELLDVDANSLKLKTLDVDVDFLEGNVSQLHASMWGLYDEIGIVNQSLTSLSNLSDWYQSFDKILTELNETNTRINSAELETLNLDVGFLRNNVSELRASVLGLNEEIAIVNRSLAELEMSDTAVLYSNVSTLYAAIAEVKTDILGVVDAVGANEQELEDVGNILKNQSYDFAIVVGAVEGINGNQERQWDAIDGLWGNASRQQVLIDSTMSRISEVNLSMSVLMENATLRHTSLEESIEDLSNSCVQWQNTVWEQQLEIDSLNLTNHEQQLEISVLNLTNHEQQSEIRQLRLEMGVMNHSLDALTSVVEQLLQATTFASAPETVVPETVADSTTDCSTGCGTTVATKSAIGVSMCYDFPCTGDVVEIWAWDREVLVVAEIQDDIDASFEFSLRIGDDVVWSDSGTQFSSFVPSQVGVSSMLEYEMVVSATIDGTADNIIVPHLVFSAPPSLHSVQVVKRNGSNALNRYDVVVDASDATDLTYAYWVVDVEEGWKYLDSVGGAETVLDVPSTRDFVLEVVVTNAVGSSVTCGDCPFLKMSDYAAEHVLEEVRTFVNDSRIVLISGIDAGGDLTELFTWFLYDLNTSMASLEVALLSEFVENGVVDGVLDAFTALESHIISVGEATIALYVATMDEYAMFVQAQDNPLDGVSSLDNHLESFCVANEFGQMPDGGVTEFSGDAYSVSCASTLKDVVVKAGAALFTTSVDELSTVTVTAWNGTLNATDGVQLLSVVYGVHVTSEHSVGETAVGDGHTLSIGIEGADAVRKSATCQYYDETRGVWSQRGVYLRGLALHDFNAVAICASSHLTLFSIGDGLESVKLVEDKVSNLVDRVAAINGVDLFGADTEINWPMLAAFGSVTFVFLVTVVVAKLAGREQAVDIGRRVFRTMGELKRPAVMGSIEYEGLLRQWIVDREALKLLALEVLTTNPFLGMLFHWEHEEIVFGRADKAVAFYGAVLMTFLSSAFLFDPNESSSDEFPLALWSVFVSAALTNVLLLPIQHILPYMVDNVNSISTSTHVPMTLLKRELARLRRRMCCGSAKTVVDIRAKVLLHWLKLVTGGKTEHSDNKSDLNKVPIDLKFLKFTVKVHTKTHQLSEETKKFFDGAKLKPSVEKTIRRFQLHVKQQLAVRNLAREVEFDSWYANCRTERRVLAGLSAGVLIVLSVFTLIICLLLSGAFAQQETLMLVEDVGKSIVMQTLVTDPGVGLFLVLLKLLFSWMLLNVGRRRAKKKLTRKQDSLDVQETETLGEIEILDAKSKALEVVSYEDIEAVTAEKERQEKMKNKCELSLNEIASAKVNLVTLRNTTDRPRKVEVERWKLEEGKLKYREERQRRALQSIETALAVLGGDHGDAEEELQEAQESLAKLRKRLGKIEQAKALIRREREKIEDRQVKRTSVMPMPGSHGKVGAVEEVQEEDVDRVVIPVLRNAWRQGDVNLVGDGRDHSPSTRLGSRRKRLMQKRSSQLKRDYTKQLQSKPNATKSRLSRRMTWAEIRALQAELKAKASQQRGPTRRKPMRTSPKLIKLMRNRRARIQKMLKNQAEE